MRYRRGWDLEGKGLVVWIKFANFAKETAPIYKSLSFNDNGESVVILKYAIMNTFDITVPVEVLEYGELTAGEARLVDVARDATYRSYAPYSKFSVGAAIELSNGEIVPGSNQENVAFPSGTCAERSACFYAHGRFPDARFTRIAVAARGADGEFVPDPIPPCGACRQALLEYETLAGGDVPVLLVGRDKVYRLKSLKSLMPLAFTEF